jgi:GntR family transcriptional regulator, transcriptional repressor for pyruvate dehydrogenase complex
MPHAEITALEREETLAARVREQLESLIARRAWLPGERLPAERQLAGQFGVSRTVIREAVAGLAARGLVSVAGGSGATVTVPLADSVGRSLTLFLRGNGPRIPYAHIHQVRSLLEVEIAACAARERTEAQLQALEATLEALQACTRPDESYAALDVRFHARLAEASGNPLFPLLLNALTDALTEVRRSGSLAPGALEEGWRGHRAIYESVAAGDPDRAWAAMKEHLAASQEIQRWVEENEAG